MLVGEGGSFDAANNWWGTNADPSGYIAFAVTVSPWLVLNITAAPSEIATGGSSAIRINITNNSAGTDTTGGGIFVQDGIPVAYELTSGTGSLAPQDGTITSGANTTTFTPAGTGSCTVTATVDGLAVSHGFTVASPFHTLNPGDSIQQNITDALDGDTIILNPGTYRESGIVVPKNITILANTSKGGSAADTMIDGMRAAGIFTVSPGIAFTARNLSLQNGTAAKGGAINAGSDSVVSLSSSSIANCSATTAGGGIYAFHGTVDISSSSLAGCSATNYGGAIYASGSTVTVTSSALTGSSAPYGGAVYAGGSTVNVHFSRLYNNTATMLWSSGGTVDAPDNWWGTNADPSGFTSGGVTVNPWLVLTITAIPSSISTSGTSTFRANLTRNSAGTDTAGGGVFVPARIPVTFKRTSGTGSLLPQAGNITSGANTTRFTPAGTGTSTVSATVDGQTVSVPIAVAARPVANFTATPRSGLAPLTVRFTDRSTNAPTSWKWTFGDGSAVNSTRKNPVHTYAATGTYNVTLKVTNVVGSNTTKKTGYIIVTALPPTVTAVNPASGIRGALVPVTNISGTGFRAGAKVFLNRTGRTSLTATNVSVVSVKKITCTVKIPAGAVIGPWNVMVRNTDGKSGTKAHAFMVKTPVPPTVTGITPASGNRGQLIPITNLSGTGFVGVPKPTVQLLKNSAVITATNVTAVSAKKITCTIKIPAGAATGAWNVRVINGDNQAGTRAGAFTVNV